MRLRHMTLYITVGKGNFLLKQSVVCRLVHVGVLHIKHVGRYTQSSNLPWRAAHTETLTHPV